MLCLSRKIHEKIFIGPPGPRQIVVTVLEITKGNVRLDIAAPRDLLVLRGELQREDDAAEYESRVD